MRVLTPEIKVIDGLCGTKVCLLLVFVFVCSSSTVTAADNTTVQLRRPSNLTSQQRDSAVTIVFRDINIKNRTAVDFARREVRRKILDYLNRKKSIAASTSSTTAAPSTSIVSTVIVTTSAIPDITTAPTTPTTTAAALTAAPTTFADEATTQTPTTVTTSAATTQSPVTTIATEPPVPPPNACKKRRRRDSGESNYIFTEEDIIFVENDYETDEYGNLIISVSIGNEEFKGNDLLDILKYNLSISDDELETIAPVVNIFRGLPLPNTGVSITIEPTTTDKVLLVEAGYQVWLPILLAIFLLLIIFIFVCCWRATHKKRKANNCQKIIPTQDSKPSPSNGHAPPRILDDNYGWLVPYEHFSSEKK